MPDVEMRNSLQLKTYVQKQIIPVIMISLFLDQDTKYNNNINIKERKVTHDFFCFCMLDMAFKTLLIK